MCVCVSNSACMCVCACACVCGIRFILSGWSVYACMCMCVVGGRAVRCLRKEPDPHHAGSVQVDVLSAMRTDICIRLTDRERIDWQYA